MLQHGRIAAARFRGRCFIRFRGAKLWHESFWVYCRVRRKTLHLNRSRRTVFPRYCCDSRGKFSVSLRWKWKETSSVPYAASLTQTSWHISICRPHQGKDGVCAHDHLDRSINERKIEQWIPQSQSFKVFLHSDLPRVEWSSWPSLTPDSLNC